MAEKLRIEQAHTSDRQEVLAFLERQGLVENAWLIREVSDALQRCEVWESVMICRIRGELVGVANIFDQGKFPAEYRAPGFQPREDYDVRMDAVGRGAMEALIEALPTDHLVFFRSFRPMIQEYFRELPDAICSEGDPYFTVSPECFRPVAGEGVIELTAADIGLFEGCERHRSWEDKPEEAQIFAIVRDERAATSTAVVPITPAIGTKRRVMIISGLYTETQYRRMGLGRQLVSHVTEMILRDGHVPMYWTEPENTASLALAEGLGYRQIGQEISCRWRVHVKVMGKIMPPVFCCSKTCPTHHSFGGCGVGV